MVSIGDEADADVEGSDENDAVMKSVLESCDADDVEEYSATVYCGAVNSCWTSRVASTRRTQASAVRLPTVTNLHPESGAASLKYAYS